MGIKSISYLVSTRIMAGFIVIIPLYAMAIILCSCPKVTTTFFYGQSFGTYEHYFRTFCVPRTCSGRSYRRSYLGHRDDQPLLLRLFRSGGPSASARRGPVNAYLIGCDRLRGPVRIVGAVRRRPEFNLTV